VAPQKCSQGLSSTLLFSSCSCTHCIFGCVETRASPPEPHRAPLLVVVRGVLSISHRLLSHDHRKLGVATSRVAGRWRRRQREAGYLHSFVDCTAGVSPLRYQVASNPCVVVCRWLAPAAATTVSTTAAATTATIAAISTEAAPELCNNEDGKVRVRGGPVALRWSWVAAARSARTPKPHAFNADDDYHHGE
jgi:hypothetical protein